MESHKNLLVRQKSKELETQMLLARQLEYLAQEQCEKLVGQVAARTRMLQKLRTTLRNKSQSFLVIHDQLIASH